MHADTQSATSPVPSIAHLLNEWEIKNEKVIEMPEMDEATLELWLRAVLGEAPLPENVLILSFTAD